MYRFKKTAFEPKKGQRILVTSDIHGNLGHLDGLLKKADFGKNDILVVVGDTLEKGPESLNTLRYLMNLCRNGQAVATIGNVDYWMLEMARTTCEHPASAGELLGYIKRLRGWKGTCFYDEMFREIGCMPENETELVDALRRVLTEFKAEFDFLESLPTVLETEKFVFVHGGLPHGDDEFNKTPDSEKNALQYLKYDCFLGKIRAEGRRFNKYIVCGHWPTPNYGGHILCANPIFDEETHTVSIDGGCGLIEEGQLNLLVLPSADCDISEIETIAYDGKRTAIALEDQDKSSDPISIGWFDNSIDIIDKAEDFVLIEKISCRRRLWVTADTIWYTSAGEAKARQCTDYLLPISAGEVISVVKITSRGILAKKNGVIGWYKGKISEMNEI